MTVTRLRGIWRAAACVLLFFSIDELLSIASRVGCVLKERRYVWFFQDDLETGKE